MSEYVRQVDQLARPMAPKLGWLDIELTERCNNDCIHCYINLPANDAGARQREMTAGQVKLVLQQAAGLGCLQIRFTGGEPLLRPDFEELYLFARHLGMKVLLFTNARLVTTYIADLFARIPPLEPIEVTVYGMHKESYEAASHVPGSFESFWRGVNLLQDRKVPFIVKSALLPSNRAEMDEFEAWAKTIPWMKARPGYSLFFELRGRRDDPLKNQQIESLRLSPEKALAVLTREPQKYFHDMVSFASKFMGPAGDKLFSCGAGVGGMCVDAYGRIQPCMGLRAPGLTVDGSAGLPEALDQFTRLGELRAKNQEYLRRCAQCFLKGLCEQCPARSWSESGTLDTPVEYLCELAHTQARYLGWLDENEHGWEVTDWRERVSRTAAANGFADENM